MEATTEPTPDFASQKIDWDLVEVLGELTIPENLQTYLNILKSPGYNPPAEREGLKAQTEIPAESKPSEPQLLKHLNKTS